MDNNNPYLRPLEAAQYLRVSKATLWNYIKQGKIKTRKLSERVTLVLKSDLDALAGGESMAV